MILNMCSCDYLLSVYALWWMFIHVFCPFSNWIGFFFLVVLNFESSFYTLGTSPLLDMLFSNIFSHSIACLLIISQSKRCAPSFIDRSRILYKSGTFCAVLCYHILAFPWCIRVELIRAHTTVVSSRMNWIISLRMKETWKS